MLVQDTHALLATLRRMHVLNDSVMFWNEERTLKLMLRNDPVDADTLACELAIVYDEDCDDMHKLVELNNDGYVDEPGTFVIDAWSFSATDVTPEDLAKAAQAIDNAYTLRICPCGSYLVKDDAAMCCMCHMTSTPGGRAPQFCAICHEDGLAMHMTGLPCCKKRLHGHCLQTWRTKSGDDRCPLCRV